MEWNDVIEYMSMTDEDFAYETGLSKDKLEKAKKKLCYLCQDKDSCTAFLPLGECCLNKEKKEIKI